MTPWYGTTSILLAAQLNKKFPGGAFLSKQCQRFGETSEREFCDLLYWWLESISLRCHAGSYWPFAKFLWHPSSSFSADIMMWDTRRSPMQFFGVKRKRKRCDDLFLVGLEDRQPKCTDGGRFFVRVIWNDYEGDYWVSGWVRIIIPMLWKRLFFGRWWSDLQSSESFWNFCLSMRFRQPMNLSKKTSWSHDCCTSYVPNLWDYRPSSPSKWECFFP